MSSTDLSAIACPTVGMESVSQVVRALFGYKKPASYKDLASAADIHPVHASKSLSTSKDVGFTRTIRRGIYELTDEGEEFARMLSIGDREEAQRILQQTILGNPSWVTILRFLTTKKSLEKTVRPIDLAADVERRSGKRWSVSMREKTGSFLMSILNDAGLIDSTGQPSLSTLELPFKKSLLPVAADLGRRNEHSSSRSYASMIQSTKSSPEYAEFSIPDFFIVFVKKNPAAIDYLRKQLADGSVFSSWLEAIESEIKMKEADNDEVND